MSYSRPTSRRTPLNTVLSYTTTAYLQVAFYAKDDYTSMQLEFYSANT